MRNNWLAKGAKYYPFILLIFLCLGQHYSTTQALQSYNNHTKEQYDYLREQMDKDDIPPKIRNHIIYVSTSSTSATSNIINSLVGIQNVFQGNMLIILFLAYLALSKNKKEEAQSNH